MRLRPYFLAGFTVISFEDIHAVWATEADKKYEAGIRINFKNKESMTLSSSPLEIRRFIEEYTLYLDEKWKMEFNSKTSAT